MGQAWVRKIHSDSDDPNYGGPVIGPYLQWHVKSQGDIDNRSSLSLDSHVSNLRLRFAIAICDFSALMYAIFVSNFLNHFKEIQLSFYISVILFIFKCLLFFICIHLLCTC